MIITSTIYSDALIPMICSQGNYSSDEAVEGTNPEMTHGELEYTYVSISDPFPS